MFSFLPKPQHNRRHLARQGQPRHGRLHPAPQQILIKIAPRIASATGVYGRALEETLEFVVVVDVETTDCRRPLTLQLSLGVAVFSAAPRLQGQPAVGPQLSLGAETMWCLQQSDQKGHSNGAESRD